MCTVSYIPGSDRILFSSSRDESPRRKPASRPAIVKGIHRTLYYPSDGAAGGSWIGLNDAGDLLILLNGGFLNHIKKPSYEKSRGLVLTAMLDSVNPIDTWIKTDLANIEPFTIIAYCNQVLHHLVWTGFEKTHLLPDSSIPHIWSSATLYNTAAKEKRRQWFEQYMAAHKSPNSKELMNYFLYESPRDNFNGFNMNRDELVKTCSISVVELKQDGAKFIYHDALLSATAEDRFYFEMKQAEVEE